METIIIFYYVVLSTSRIALLSLLLFKYPPGTYTPNDCTRIQCVLDVEMYSIRPDPERLRVQLFACFGRRRFPKEQRDIILANTFSLLGRTYLKKVFLSYENTYDNLHVCTRPPIVRPNSGRP